MVTLTNETQTMLSFSRIFKFNVFKFNVFKFIKKIIQNSQICVFG